MSSPCEKVFEDPRRWSDSQGTFIWSTGWWRIGIIVVYFYYLIAFQVKVQENGSSGSSSLLSKPRPDRVPSPSEPKKGGVGVALLPPMTNLTALELDMLQHENDERCHNYIYPDDWISDSLLQLCWVISQSPHIVHLKLEGIDTNEGGFKRRKEPLDKLETFWTPKFGDVSLRDLRQVFAHCPNVTDLRLSDLDPRLDLPTVGELVTQCCSRVKNLGHLVDRSGDSEPEIMRAVVTRLKPATLECFYFLGPTSDCDLIQAMTKRHFSNIHKVGFERCRDLNSKDIQLMLTQFPCWRSSGSFRPMKDDDRYFERPPPIALTEEQEQFDLLEKLYRQIGSLVELEDLDLKATFGGKADDYRKPLRENSLPGLMSLGDEELGRLGFLDLLAGLTKLRTLRGSVTATTDETDETVGRAECRWMATHFPRLEKINLVSGTTLPYVSHDEKLSR
ncbi:hypothetical protein BGX23_000249 [Mortierella sp. AD031]|nr:hypothetical protein BGX23_000249 [Mortierella sp. AD031]